MQAFISQRVPYRRRGLVIGLVETSWAGCTLVGVPLIGLLMARFGWRAPFLFIGVAGLLAMGALALSIPREERTDGERSRPFDLASTWQLLVRNRAARSGIWYAFLVSLANDMLFVVYGAWLESVFGLTLVALGMATTVIGAAELLGEGLTALVSDRVGLKRALLVGLGATTACYAFLPLAGGGSLTAALGGLFLVFLTYEFSLVTSISLFTEVLPAARATMMAGLYASGAVGRVMGAAAGGLIWLKGGMAAVGVTAAVISAMALLVVLVGLRGWQPERS
jgi:predicted MFS family arabinose efflux permease